MKSKSMFLGAKKKTNQCCILTSAYSFEELNDNINDIEPSDFKHSATNWSGQDEAKRTMKIKNLRLTGRIIELPKEILFSGTTCDMGNSYYWRCFVDTLLEVEENET